MTSVKLIAKPAPEVLVLAVSKKGEALHIEGADSGLTANNLSALTAVSALATLDAIRFKRNDCATKPVVPTSKVPIKLMTVVL